jgi:hypothetical protein
MFRMTMVWFFLMTMATLKKMALNLASLQGYVIPHYALPS